MAAFTFTIAQIEQAANKAIKFVETSRKRRFERFISNRMAVRRYWLFGSTYTREEAEAYAFGLEDDRWDTNANGWTIWGGDMLTKAENLLKICSKIHTGVIELEYPQAVDIVNWLDLPEFKSEFKD